MASPFNTAGPNYHVSAPYRLQHNRFLLRLLEKVRGNSIGKEDSVLDVGCGPGCIVDQLWNVDFAPGHVLAIDRDHQRDLSPQWRSGGNREFLAQDVLAWNPCAGSQFSIAYSSSAIHWIITNREREKRFYHQMLHALKPGGYFVACIPGAENFFPIFTKLLLQAFTDMGHRLADRGSYMAHRLKFVRFFKNCGEVEDVPCKDVGFEKQIILRSAEWETWRISDIVDMWMSAGHTIFQGACDLQRLREALMKLTTRSALENMGISVSNDGSVDYITPYSYRYYVILRKPNSAESRPVQWPTPSFDPALPMSGFDPARKWELTFETKAREDEYVWSAGPPENLELVFDLKTRQSRSITKVEPFIGLARALGRSFVYGIYLITGEEGSTQRSWLGVHNKAHPLPREWRLKYPKTVTKTLTPLETRLESQGIHGISLLLAEESVVLHHIAEYARLGTNVRQTANASFGIGNLWVIGNHCRSENEHPPTEKNNYVRSLGTLPLGQTLCLLWEDDRVGEAVYHELLDQDQSPGGTELLKYLRWHTCVTFPQLFILCFTRESAENNVERDPRRFSAGIAIDLQHRTDRPRGARNPPHGELTPAWNLSDVRTIGAYLKTLSLWRERESQRKEFRKEKALAITHDLDWATAILEKYRDAIAAAVPLAGPAVDNVFLLLKWDRGDFERIPQGALNAFQGSEHLLRWTFIGGYYRALSKGYLPSKATGDYWALEELWDNREKWLGTVNITPIIDYLVSSKFKQSILNQIRLASLHLLVSSNAHSLRYAFQNHQARDFDDWKTVKPVIRLAEIRCAVNEDAPDVEIAIANMGESAAGSRDDWDSSRVHSTQIWPSVPWFGPNLLIEDFRPSRVTAGEHESIEWIAKLTVKPS